MTYFISGVFRYENYPTIYADLSKRIWINIPLFQICSLFIILVVSFLCILPGFRGVKRLYILTRWITCFVMAFFLIACNFLPYWEEAHLDIRTPYRAGSDSFINATVGVFIGLRGVNITLKGLPVNQQSDIIDYNEQFTWTWSQGKPGFGYNAGPFQKQYREGQLRGLPYPILWIAETFTVDYEYVRIGRCYRRAGWFAHVFLWLALPLFILANILFQMVIQYGSLFIIFTGLSLLIANLSVTLMASSIPLKLSFLALDSNETQQLITHYSWCYYANLLNGVCCIMIGLITLFADLRFPDEIADFFGNDVLQCYEDYFADPHDKIADNNGISVAQTNSDDEVLLRKRRQLVKLESSELPRTSGLKKKSLSGQFSRFQKSTIRKVVKPQTELIQHHNKMLEQFQELIESNPQPFETISEDEENEI